MSLNINDSEWNNMWLTPSNYMKWLLMVRNHLNISQAYLYTHCIQRDLWKVVFCYCGTDNNVNNGSTLQQECMLYIHVCVGSWDTNQLTGINSPRTSAWETDSHWYAEVEWRRAPGVYKKKKLATKLASSQHKYQSSNSTK